VQSCTADALERAALIESSARSGKTYKVAANGLAPGALFMVSSPIKIAIIGGGSVGGYLAYRLGRSGQDVHLLAGTNYYAIARDGISLSSERYCNHKPIFTKVYRNLGEMPECDWIFLCTNSTANSELLPKIPGIAAPGAKVINFQSGLAVEDSLRSMLPTSIHLLGGVYSLRVQREAFSVIRQVKSGSLRLGYHSGPFQSTKSSIELLAEGAALFLRAGIAARDADLDQPRWEKLLWDVPFQGLSALLGKGTAPLIKNRDARNLIGEIMAEVSRVAARHGTTLDSDLREQLIDATAAAENHLPTMYFDRIAGRPLELDMVYGKLLKLATTSGCSLPRTDVLHRTLQNLDTRDTNAATQLSDLL
jgi:2-dehydropantoate 2-reductase